MQLLTIDWDVFFPEDPLWDLGHRESPLFQGAIWETRVHLVDQVTMDPMRHLFWKMIDLSNAGEIIVSDSHLDVHDVLCEFDIDSLILIDAHHDCWPIEDKNDLRIDCSNWLRFWIQYRGLSRVHFFQPDWASELYPTPEDIWMQVKKHDLWREKAFLPWFKPDLVHVCRSGCWTPPWFDDEFIRFVEEPRLHIDERTREGWLAPMDMRMDIEKARSLKTEREAAFADFKQISQTLPR